MQSDWVLELTLYVQSLIHLIQQKSPNFPFFRQLTIVLHSLTGLIHIAFRVLILRRAQMF